MTDLVSLSCADCTAAVAPERGALVTSFQVRGRELLYLDRATFLDVSRNVRGGIPILFPAPGKLVDDRWQHEGKTGAMKQHGFARNRSWQVRSAQAERVTLELRSDEATLAEFPWPFTATLQLELAPSQLRLTMEIRNDGAESMPFALGYHPYFAVKDKARAAIITDATRQFDNVSKQSGALEGFDLTAPELDVHLLDQKSRDASLRLGDGGTIRVSASNEFAHWVVWTVAGKDYVCLEPWTAPGNALNTGSHLLRLAPGEVHRSFMQIDFTAG